MYEQELSVISKHFEQSLPGRTISHMFGGRYRDERILASATGDNAEVDE